MKEIKLEHVTVSFDDSPEMKSKVFDRVVEFFTKHKAFRGEVIMQSDNPLIDAPNVLSDIADDVINFKEDFHDE